MTRQTFFKIFDIKMCASEIWGTVRLDDIEKVHMMACKRVFFRSSSENTEQDGSW